MFATDGMFWQEQPEEIQEGVSHGMIGQLLFLSDALSLLARRAVYKLTLFAPIAPYNWPCGQSSPDLLYAKMLVSLH